MADLSAEEIRELQQEAVNNLRIKIIRDLIPRKYYSYLRQKRVFDEDDTELIRSKPTQKEKSELFLDLVCKHPDGFRALCEALYDDGTQVHIVEEMTREFQRLKQTYIENKG